MRRRLALTVMSITALLVPAGAAHAAFFPAESVDGPSADIRSVSDLDVARDGTGAVAYLRRDAGVDHVYVSRLNNGVFQSPERIDPGIATAATQAAVAASDGGRVAVVFVSGGQVFATVRAEAGSGWSPPQMLAASGSDPSVDMSIYGVGYATFTSGGNVLAARLDRGSTTFSGIDTPLDVDPAAVAGVGTDRSRVAIAADATGVAVWGEAGHVYARRLYNGSVSSTPVDLTMGDLEGHAAGAATLPDVDIEDDSSFAWIAFRQAFVNGPVMTSRAIGRRLRGSRLEDPVVYDGLGWGAGNVEAPRIDLNGKGQGVATAGTSTGGALAGILKDDILNTAITVGGNGSPSQPIGAIAETTDRVVGWINAGDGTVHGLFYDDRPDVRTVPPPGPDTLLSAPDFGPVDPSAGFDVAGNRAGDFSFVFVQGTGDGRRLVAASYDRPPGSMSSYTSSKRWRNVYRAPLMWSPALDLWGPLTYTVLVDGRQVAQTQDTKAVLPPAGVSEGVHNWRVTATDRRGQSSTTVVKPLKVDTVAPAVKFSIKRKMRVATVTAKAADVLPPSGQAAGIAYVRIDFGDGTGYVEARKAVHRYRHTGSFDVKVSATDRAGNVGVATRRLRIGKK
jgi:hypothetical protein